MSRRRTRTNAVTARTAVRASQGAKPDQPLAPRTAWSARAGVADRATTRSARRRRGGLPRQRVRGFLRLGRVRRDLLHLLERRARGVGAAAGPLGPAHPQPP